ncbi:MAG: hypothetical protein K940chlam9_01424 [Chlamydiae bacterium]|nr:hypothetical protein [Chlamydiota bacterium]
MNKEIEALFEELIEGQKEKVLTCGRTFVPTLTSEDALQPNDYPELENNPHFRYEEGVLEGLQTAQTALRTHLHRNKNKKAI